MGISAFFVHSFFKSAEVRADGFQIPHHHKALFVACKHKKQSQSKQKKMAKDNFSELSTKDLIKKKKYMTFAMGLLIGVLTALFVVTIFNTINKGVTTLLAVPFALLPVLIMCYGQINSMNKELKSRTKN